MLGARRVRSSKLHSLLLLCLSETTTLIKTHRDWLSQAEDDVAHLLQSMQTNRALLWVERVIREQNLLDVLAMVQRILLLLHAKAPLILINKQCPNELREAIASLIYAAPRFCDCAKLHKISKILSSKFMRHSYNYANEASNEMLKLLSTKQPSLERRLVTMENIARLHGITLNFNKISFSEFD